MIGEASIPGRASHLKSSKLHKNYLRVNHLPLARHVGQTRVRRPQKAHLLLGHGLVVVQLLLLCVCGRTGTFDSLLVLLRSLVRDRGVRDAIPGRFVTIRTSILSIRVLPTGHRLGSLLRVVVVPQHWHFCVGVEPLPLSRHLARASLLLRFSPRRVLAPASMRRVRPFLVRRSRARSRGRRRGGHSVRSTCSWMYT